MKKEVPEELKDFPLSNLFAAALCIGNASLTSGTLPNLTTGGKIASPGNLAAQTQEALSKALAYLEHCHHDIKDLALMIILTTKPIDDTEEGQANYALINTVWTRTLGECPEVCRMAFQVKGLPKGALIEIFALSVA